VTSYNILIETRTDGTGEIATGAAEEFAEEIAEQFQGIVTVGGTPAGWGAQLVYEAKDALDAAASSAELVVLLADKVGLPRWPVVRAEVVREDVYREDLTRPQLPDLVSGPEVAEILGVSTQRVHALAADNPKFPAPVYRLRAATLWLRPAIEKFDQGRVRKAGRPPKDGEIR
jgi:hypothetical protein